MQAAENGNMKQFENLYKMDPTRLEYRNSKGRTCIHFAASANRCAIIQFIVDHGGSWFDFVWLYLKIITLIPFGSFTIGRFKYTRQRWKHCASWSGKNRCGRCRVSLASTGCRLHNFKQSTVRAVACCSSTGKSESVGSNRQIHSSYWFEHSWQTWPNTFARGGHSRPSEVGWNIGRSTVLNLNYLKKKISFNCLIC